MFTDLISTVLVYCSLLEEFNECVNSTGYSDYNIPAYVHFFMRKHITVNPKKGVFWLFHLNLYFPSIMGFSTQIIIFVTNKLVCQE